MFQIIIIFRKINDYIIQIQVQMFLFHVGCKIRWQFHTKKYNKDVYCLFKINVKWLETCSIFLLTLVFNKTLISIANVITFFNISNQHLDPEQTSTWSESLGSVPAWTSSSNLVAKTFLGICSEAILKWARTCFCSDTSNVSFSSIRASTETKIHSKIFVITKYTPNLINISLYITFIY